MTPDMTPDTTHSPVPNAGPRDTGETAITMKSTRPITAAVATLALLAPLTFLVNQAGPGEPVAAAATTTTPTPMTAAR